MKIGRHRRAPNEEVHGQRGFSLLSAIIGLALASALALGLAQIMKNAFRSQARVDNDVARDGIAQMFLSATDCAKTMGTSGCTAGDLVAIKRKLSDGTTVVLAAKSGTGTKYGKYTVRAVCNATGDGLILQATLLKSDQQVTATATSAFIPDPLTEIATTWADPKAALLPVGVELCASSVGNSNAWVQIDPGSTQGPNYVYYSDGDDHSPTAVCTHAGYKHFLGACRSTFGGTPIEGSITANRYYLDASHTMWGLACMFGNGGFWFPATGKAEILCGP